MLPPTEADGVQGPLKKGKRGRVGFHPKAEARRVESVLRLHSLRAALRWTAPVEVLAMLPSDLRSLRIG